MLPTAMANLSDIPLAEMPALGRDVLGAAIGRAVPAAVVSPVPTAVFQSSI
jgi:FXSXX-COOH protein